MEPGFILSGDGSVFMVSGFMTDKYPAGKNHRAGNYLRERDWDEFDVLTDGFNVSSRKSTSKDEMVIII